MCRNIHCLMMMQGQRVGMDELMALLQQRFGGSKPEKEPTHEEAIAAAIEGAETQARGLEVALKILRQTPPEDGAKLVGLEVGMPKDPKKHGVSSVASYELEGGSFLVIGIDHLTQEKIEHTSPNEHGVEGLVMATREELTKKAVAAAEASEAVSKAEAQTTH
jgi:hypothetical protein